MPADDLQVSASPLEEQGNFRLHYGGSTNTLFNCKISQHSTTAVNTHVMGTNKAHVFGKEMATTGPDPDEKVMQSDDHSEQHIRELATTMPDSHETGHAR